MEKIFIGTVTLATLLLALFDPSTGWRMQRVLEGHAGRTVDETRIENTALKAEIAGLLTAKRPTSVVNNGYRSAFVYSRYPFNFKNEMLVSAGSEQGLRVGQAAFFMPGDAETPTAGRAIMVGQVTQVFTETALVRTVFDPAFQLAVRIGTPGVDALLKGGTEPKLVLVPKTAALDDGDAVYTATAELSYGLPLGELTNVRLASDQLFQEADLRLGYDIPDLRVVWFSTGRTQDATTKTP